MEFTDGNERPRPSGLDYITKLIVPVLAVIAVIVVQFVSVTKLNGKQVWVSLGLIGIAGLSVVVGLLPSFKAWLHRRSKRKADARAANYAFPEMRNFVRRFGNFVDGRTNDSLHAIINDRAAHGNTDLLVVLGNVDIGLWQAFRYFVAIRLEKEQPTFEGLKIVLMEFHNLVGCYNNYCVSRIFDRLPQELLVPLPADTKAALNLFQQKFNHFLTDYETFADKLCRSRPGLENAARTFPHPKPLQ